jgi:Lrp/AsnC family leucine-responsive transcriptional regulator
MMKVIRIDPVDKSILQVLQRNGRATINDVSDVVGLSPSPVARRVRLLEEAGIITGYAAQIDEVALGYGLSVFVSVKLDKQIVR